MSKKTGQPFLNVACTSDLTPEQAYLIMWVDYYSEIFAMDDVKRPSDHIIQNDEALDNWAKVERSKTVNKLIEYYNAIDSPSGNQSNKTVIGHVGSKGTGAASRVNG